MSNKETKDTRSRKWLLTINNPLDHNYCHYEIKLKLSEFKSILYWCMCDEIGESGTYHTHLYLVFNNATRFSTIKSKFTVANILMAKGTSQENRDYITKDGKYKDSEKKNTNIALTFEEFGEMPIERQGQRNDIEDLYAMIKEGMSNFEILEDSPQFLFSVDKIERVRQIIKEEKYKDTFRNLQVNYIFGDTGTGKTRSVMELYGYDNVYRITDYDHPFDSYKGQDVVVFEEFRSSLKIQDMLNYLDGYPLVLPCRYANKIACYSLVYIITNIDIREQYKSIQDGYIETWNAFLRRIHFIHKYSNCSVNIYNIKDYMNNCLNGEQLFIDMDYNDDENPFS